jgi:hypothetical protein
VAWSYPLDKRAPVASPTNLQQTAEVPGAPTSWGGARTTACHRTAGMLRCSLLTCQGPASHRGAFLGGSCRKRRSAVIESFFGRKKQAPSQEAAAAAASLNERGQVHHCCAVAPQLLCFQSQSRATALLPPFTRHSLHLLATKSQQNRPDTTIQQKIRSSAAVVCLVSLVALDGLHLLQSPEGLQLPSWSHAEVAAVEF